VGKFSGDFSAICSELRELAMDLLIFLIGKRRCCQGILRVRGASACWELGLACVRAGIAVVRSEQQLRVVV
jgi:hypothetical protein